MLDESHIDKARAVRIEHVIAGRNIRLSKAGRIERCGPCPSCGGTDRFSINTRKQVFNCRVCRQSGDVIALVQALDGVAFKMAVETLAGATGWQVGPARHVVASEPTDEAQRKANMAAWLWGRREPVSESNAAGLYLRKRGYGGQFPSTLGYLPPNGKHPPAMIAAFGICDEPEPGLIAPPNFITGVHLTRLTLEGGKAPVDPVKITLGPSMGLPIVLAPANDLLAIDITGGIETGLSVLEWRSAGVWVAGAAGRMPRLMGNLPAYTECLHIFAERDEAGLRFAREAARIAAARGIETHVKAFEAR